jgi:hypothetical protein
MCHDERHQRTEQPSFSSLVVPVENTAKLFDETVYDGIFRDDGLVILDGVKSNAEVGDPSKRK